MFSSTLLAARPGAAYDSRRKVLFMRMIVLLFCGLSLAACSQRPDVDAMLGPPPPGNNYPALLPLGELQALDTELDPEETAANAALLARAEELRDRAAALGTQNGT
jgi:hypothetical protein